jgi:hypothetical protein
MKKRDLRLALKNALDRQRGLEAQIEATEEATARRHARIVELECARDALKARVKELEEKNRTIQCSWDHQADLALKRIEELEAELSQERRHFDEIDDYRCELEAKLAADQWHPASEPPDEPTNVFVSTQDGLWVGWHRASEAGGHWFIFTAQGQHRARTVTHWRELDAPPDTRQEPTSDPPSPSKPKYELMVPQPEPGENGGRKWDPPGKNDVAISWEGDRCDPSHPLSLRATGGRSPVHLWAWTDGERWEVCEEQPREVGTCGEFWCWGSGEVFTVSDGSLAITRSAMAHLKELGIAPPWAAECRCAWFLEKGAEDEAVERGGWFCPAKGAVGCDNVGESEPCVGSICRRYQQGERPVKPAASQSAEGSGEYRLKEDLGGEATDPLLWPNRKGAGMPDRPSPEEQKEIQEAIDREIIQTVAGKVAPDLSPAKLELKQATGSTEQAPRWRKTADLGGGTFIFEKAVPVDRDSLREGDKVTVTWEGTYRAPSGDNGASKAFVEPELGEVRAVDWKWLRRAERCEKAEEG